MRTATRLPAVETPRLMLREIRIQDARGFSNFMLQDEYQRFIAIRLANTAEVSAFVARTIARQGDAQRSVFHLTAEEKLTGEAIGDGFLIRQRSRTAEIGWGLHPAMWRMGLGREIGLALLGIAFERLGAEETWCKVMRGNDASTRLAGCLGMRHVKTHANYPAGPGRNITVDVFALRAEAYFEAGY